MAIFDLSFANPNFAKSGKDYSYLLDQLSIKENQLAGDGKLSPGDYAVLAAQARAIRTFPG